jgi:hypothetical protein
MKMYDYSFGFNQIYNVQFLRKIKFSFPDTRSSYILVLALINIWKIYCLTENNVLNKKKWYHSWFSQSYSFWYKPMYDYSFGFNQIYNVQFLRKIKFSFPHGEMLKQCPVVASILDF